MRCEEEKEKGRREKGELREGSGHFDSPQSIIEKVATFLRGTARYGRARCGLWRRLNLRKWMGTLVKYSLSTSAL